MTVNRGRAEPDRVGMEVKETSKRTIEFDRFRVSYNSEYDLLTISTFQGSSVCIERSDSDELIEALQLVLDRSGDDT